MKSKSQLNVKDFYNKNQDIIENLWEEHLSYMQDSYEHINYMRNSEDAFWEYVEQLMEEGVLL